MKKIVVMIIAVLLLTVMLTSCRREETIDGGVTAEKILAEVVSSMNACVSVEATSEAGITTYLNYNPVTISSNVEMIYHIEEKDVYYYNNSSFTVFGTGIKVSLSSIEAFNDGKYFLFFSSDGDKKHLYSENTAEDFLEYISSADERPNVLDSYSKSSYVINEDGDYEITLSDYEETLVDSVNEAFALPLVSGGIKIADINVTVTADAKSHLVKKVTTEYLFLDGKSVGRETVTYKNHNCAVKNYSAINPNKYTKVSDALAIPRMLKLIEETKNCTQGTLSFSMLQSVVANGVQTSYNESSTVSYGERVGKYFFDIVSEINGELYSLIYKNGSYRINGEDSPNFDNDLSAKQFINGLIDPFNIMPCYINDMTVWKSGSQTVYTFDVDCDCGDAASTIGAMNYKLNSTVTEKQITLKITVIDGALASMEYTMFSIGQNKYEKYDVTTYINTRAVFNG